MKVLAFGEILYDVFGKDAKIGGAPLNFAAHFSKLGGKGYVCSAVGNDALGDQAIRIAADLGVHTEYITRNRLQTGFCNITYNGEEPVYDLSAICAYDHIEISNEAYRVMQSEGFDVLYFGTLAQRSEVSRRALKKLQESGGFRKLFFDMNIRQSYYSPSLLEDSLRYADIVKINRDEFELLKRMGYADDAASLCRKFQIEMLLLTLDKDGMMLYHAKTGASCFSAKPQNKVVSTVGAGDAGGACFLYNYLLGEPFEVCIGRANILGDYIVRFPEAIPEYSPDLRKKLRDVK